MLAYSASATRHDTYITYTLTRAVDGSDERADFLGCAIHVRKELRLAGSLRGEPETREAKQILTP